MNRRLLTALALSFLTVWALQYFTRKTPPPGAPGGDSGAVQSGQFYQAPVKKQWHREPKLEIDFVDTKVTQEQESLVSVETDRCLVKFSNLVSILSGQLRKTSVIRCPTNCSAFVLKPPSGSAFCCSFLSSIFNSLFQLKYHLESCRKKGRFCHRCSPFFQYIRNSGLVARTF